MIPSMTITFCNGGLHMKIKLTKRGMAMVKKMNIRSCTLKAYRPEYKQFTLIKINSSGKTISKEKVMVNINKYFKVA